MTRTGHELRTALTLRALVALGIALLVLSNRPLWMPGAPVTPQLGDWVLLGFLLSNVPILVAGRRVWRWRAFELVLVTLDTFALTTMLYPLGGSRVALVFFLVLLLVAVERGRPAQLLGATAVAGLDVAFAVAAGAAVTPALLLRVPFFYAVALYYAYFVSRAQREREMAERAHTESRELRWVVEILDDVTSALSLPDVMGKVVARLSAIVPVERISVLQLESDRGSAKVLASSDVPDFEPLQIDLGKYPEVREALRRREMILIEDASNHELLEPVRERIQGLPFNSLLVIPLVFGDEALGSLILRAASHHMKIDADQTRFCQAVANASANAVKNALLYSEVAREASRARDMAAELQNILDHSPDLVITTDAEGRVHRWNYGAERMLGWARGEVQGKPVGGFVKQLGASAACERVCEGEFLVDHEAVLERADGREVEVDLTVVPLRSETDRETGLLLVGRDVTELNANRRALQRADRLSGLGEIVSGVAHELKNPLSGVLGHAQLLSLREGLGADARRDAQRIVENAKRCRRIVRNLLDFSRRRAPEECLVSVGDLLETVLELSSYQLKTQEIRVVHEIDPRLPPTVLDPHRMEQVFLNLIQNAALSLARDESGGTITIRAREENGEILVEIADDGPGVPADIREKIFEPFFSTRQSEGTGLGLSIAVGIVEEHGGRLELAPDMGRGATFRVFLPLRAARQGQGRESHHSEVLESGGGRCVLVVVREGELRDRLTTALRKAGYGTEETSTGRVAGELLERESGIHAVVADLEGLAPNGAALAQRYGERIPFILLTADRGLARHYGPEGAQSLCPVLRKPVDLDETLSILAGLFDRVEAGGRDVAGASA